MTFSTIDKNKVNILISSILLKYVLWSWKNWRNLARLISTWGGIYSRLALNRFATFITRTLSSLIRKIVRKFKLLNFSSKKWRVRSKPLENILKVISVNLKLMLISKISRYWKNLFSVIWHKSKKYVKSLKNNSEIPLLKWQWQTCWAWGTWINKIKITSCLNATILSKIQQTLLKIYR